MSSLSEAHRRRCSNGDKMLYNKYNEKYYKCRHKSKWLTCGRGANVGLDESPPWPSIMPLKNLCHKAPRLFAISAWSGGDPTNHTANQVHQS